MTLPRPLRTFGRVVHGRIRTRIPPLAGLFLLTAALALAGAAPTLAAHAPAAGNAAPGLASETAPPAPVAPNAQETDEPQQFATPEERNDGSWIVIAVALLIALTALGVGLAALGLGGE